jgi:valyl-tRNA synthetase
MYDGKPPLKSLAFAAYPQENAAQIDLAAETDMAILQDLIVSIRNLRAELKVEPKGKVPIQVYFHDAATKNLILQSRIAVEQLANVSEITEVAQDAARQSPTRGTTRFDVRVIYEKKVDVAAECERLKKELAQIEKETSNNQRQLSNEQFLAKAPVNVVEGMRKRAGELVILHDKALAQMKELGCK